MEKSENEWIRRGLKQGVGQANLRKREKTNGLGGLKQGAGRATSGKNKREWNCRG